MRALLCESWAGWRGLRLTDVAPPPLRAGGVRIAVAYASVGYALLLQTSGRYQRKPPLPFVPGTEVSGTVLNQSSPKLAAKAITVVSVTGRARKTTMTKNNKILNIFFIFVVS